jgi:hypothetical protein
MLKAQTLGLSIKINYDIAATFIHSIRAAYVESGNDMPKHLGDVLIAIEDQLDDSRYYQPEEKYLNLAGFSSFAVWHSIDTLTEEMKRMFPGERVKINEYSGDDIEDPCFMDEQ